MASALIVAGLRNPFATALLDRVFEAVLLITVTLRAGAVIGFAGCAGGFGALKPGEGAKPPEPTG
jgi:hypothetical protein